MTTWPSELPDLPLVDGFSETIAETRLRTEMDAGPAKMRRRFAASMDQIEQRMLMTASEVQILLQFYKVTLEGGTQTFDYVHPRTGFQIPFRFVSPPQLAPDQEPESWIVAMSLEYTAVDAAPSFINLDFGNAGNSGYLALLEDI